jgi:GDP-mannose 6-dehydrogenase
LIVGLSDAHAFEALARNTREDQIVLDLVNMPERAALKARYMGLCW